MLKFLRNHQRKDTKKYSYSWTEYKQFME